MGDALVIYNTGTGSSRSCPGTSIFSELASYQDVFTKFGPWCLCFNHFKLPSKSRSKTNPRVITCKATCIYPRGRCPCIGTDGIASTGDEGFGNDFIDGTMTLNSRLRTNLSHGSLVLHFQLLQYLNG